MPVNKDALKRYQIIDEMLSDPNRDYTTNQILDKINWECEHVSIRMIQKDLNNIQDYFGKELVRNAGGRGTVKYADQSEPLFYKELTEDEERVLREVLKSLGQFDGLDNFTWLDLLKKKLAMKDDKPQQPYISFSKNEGLQIPRTLLGRLFTAISRKKVIKVTYTKFGGESKQYIVYPYQLKQFNDRWFLLCTPVGDDVFAYNPEFIMNLALDRMEEQFEYVDDMEYLETPIVLQDRFDEIIGVTLDATKDIEVITFAVNDIALNYVRTKWLHKTQFEYDEATQIDYRSKYPSLSDHTFFSIECRENNELYNLVASFTGNVVLVEPEQMRNRMKELANNTFKKYLKL